MANRLYLLKVTKIKVQYWHETRALPKLQVNMSLLSIAMIWLTSNIANFYNVAKAVNADLAFCIAQKIKRGAVEVLKNPQIESGVFSIEKKKYFLTHYISLFWTFLYRRQLIIDNGIEFPPERSAEDSYF